MMNIEDITEETHVRVFIEAGNGSHVSYFPKDKPLGLLEYPLAWIKPGDAGWHNAS